MPRLSERDAIMMAAEHGLRQLHDVTPTGTLKLMRRVRNELGRKLFQKEPRRLIWLPFHGAVLGLATLLGLQARASGVHPLWLLPVSFLVGLSFAGLAFVAHEALHGALIGNRRLARLVGFVGFFPFCVSPRLWVAWHNRVHHGNTNVAGKDPDAYPTWDEYRNGAAARYSVLIGAPRSGKWRGILTFLIGFSVQSSQVLFFAKARGHLSAKDQRWAITQTLVAWCLWASFGYLVGPALFVMLFVIPLCVGNAVVMAHIVTNHSLNPLSTENDALSTSLTVTVPRWFNFYTLGFGYHVEHHLFPGASHKRGPEISRLLETWAPSRYQKMPLTSALALLFRTPRVYRDEVTLIEPSSGETWRTLGTRSRPESPGDTRGDWVAAEPGNPVATRPRAPAAPAIVPGFELRPSDSVPPPAA